MTCNCLARAGNDDIGMDGAKSSSLGAGPSYDDARKRLKVPPTWGARIGGEQFRERAALSGVPVSPRRMATTRRNQDRRRATAGDLGLAVRRMIRRLLDR